MKPYPFDLYDKDRRWIAGWPTIDVPLTEALARVVAGLPEAVYYKRGPLDKDMRAIPKPEQAGLFG